MALTEQQLQSPSRQRWVIILVSLASFMVGLDALVVMTALPTIRVDLNAEASDLGWTISAYEIGYAALILTGASLGDRYGRRLLFVLGVAVFTAGSAMAALSGSIEMLIAARAVQGLGGGVASALAYALISASTPPEKRGAAFGIWGAVTGMAVALGPLVGGGITQALDWEWIFWVNVPVGIALVALALARIPESRGGQEPVDIPGVVLSTLGVAALASGLLRGGEDGWTSGPVLGGIVAGVVLLAAFLWWQRRTPAPLMPLSIFRNRSFSGGAAANFLLGCALFGQVFITAQYFQLVMGNDAMGVGLRLAPWVALTPFVAPVAGQLADKIGERPVIMTGFLVWALPLFAVVPLTLNDASYRMLVVPLLISGGGITAAFVTVVSAVMKSVEPARLGLAGGVSNTMRQVGSVFGVAVTVGVFSTFGGFGTPDDFLDGYAPVMIILALATILGVLAALPIRPYSAAVPAAEGDARTDRA